MKNMKNQNDKELIYTESKTLRNETLDNVSYDFLDKMKVIPYLTDDMVVTVQQAANYYECSMDTIKTLIKRNRDEFEEDGMVVLKGQELKKFKEELGVGSNEPSLSYASSLTILTKRSLLRIGMLMTSNLLATKIRNYLLNIEEKTEIDRKSWAIQREVGIIERKRMTSAISRYIPESKHKKFAYPNYTNMIYKVILGCDAKSLRLDRNVKTNDALRDSFTEDELKKVEEVETIVTGLISMDFTYKQIEQMLKDRFIKKIDKTA
jgi:hypothetical protein|uniref:Uncharacterized protein n=1 Tax=Siphoviridae sp. ctRuT6 TaxID=2826339 RepID=A0A8S5N2F4_9CAUD|nr:MAG TPA: hypothetical protein [Siphoviridae sp. ctRuT6]DAF71143.1 MAG TPA: hypothetical protein [Caudoviricetes sp.]DAQ24605.1 MAG TPA: hypothetical protein [Caudoviricetes sp.]